MSVLSLNKNKKICLILATEQLSLGCKKKTKLQGKNSHL